MMSKEVLSKEEFFNSNGRAFTLRGVVETLKAYVETAPEWQYEIVIGTDSHASLEHHAFFVSAITIRRIGNGGIHFWTRHEEHFATLRERIWREAMLSIILAQELRSMVREVFGDDELWGGHAIFRCIHLDVGENGPTRDFIDGITGMVRGYGFTPVIKPDAYGASTVADRHT
ncbi:MAG: ribonuclease H-like YkuK family protein [Patescibacteria group bacterium]